MTGIRHTKRFWERVLRRYGLSEDQLGLDVPEPGTSDYITPVAPDWVREFQEAMGAIQPTALTGRPPKEHKVPGDLTLGWFVGIDYERAHVFGVGRTIPGEWNFHEEIRIRRDREGATSAEFATYRATDEGLLYLSSTIHTGYLLDLTVAADFDFTELLSWGYSPVTGSIPGIIQRIPSVLEAIVEENEREPSNDTRIALELSPILEAVHSVSSQYNGEVEN